MGPGPGEPAEKVIGRYKLLEVLGRGGMGEVWVAEQTEPVKRQVALKLVRAGTGSREIIARFDSERQALAVMDHPNVARILDGGTTALGQPFFVMELIQGQPLTHYCDEQRLGIEQRLKLFIDVCNGVQHAHQKGIIHRDLKPGNILVSLVDGKPVPKIIDFGLARAIEGNQRLTDQSLMTGVGQILGTLRYMSPEQASLDVVDIDTRTDIYALGVILYELLTGSTPLDESALKSHGFVKVLELIREQDPVRPSRRLENSTDAQVSSITSLRQTDLSRLTRILAGDLDWIVMKALEKDRSRRYESASGFAADVRRYLDSEPVIARPPSFNYRVRKFVRKNRASVIAAALLLLTLTGGIVGTTWGMLIAQASKKREESRATSEAEARREAETNLDYSRKANDVLGSVFDNMDPGTDYSTVAELRNSLVSNLMKAADDLAHSGIGDAVVTAEMHRRLGASLLSLGAIEPAAKLFDLALTTQNQLLGPENPESLTTRAFQAMTYRHAGRLEDAIQSLAETLSIQKRVLGETHPDTLTSMSNLGDFYKYDGQWDKALTILQEAYDLVRKDDQPVDVTTLAIMNNLASTYHHARDFRSAIEILTEVVQHSTQILGSNDTKTLMSITNLASSLREFGDIKKALHLLEPNLKAKKERLGENHPRTFVTMHELAETYDAAGEYEKALSLFQQVFEFRKRTLGAEHPETLNTLNSLAIGFARLKKNDLAQPYFEEAYQINKATKGADHPQTLVSMHNLAQCYRICGKANEAVQLMEAMVDLSKSRLGPEHLETTMAMSSLGIAYFSAGKVQLAASTLEKSLPVLRSRLGDNHAHTITTINHLAECWRALGKIELAIPLFEEALPAYEAQHGSSAAETLFLMNSLAVAYWSSRQLGKSIPLYEELLARQEKQLGRQHPNTQISVANLGINYKDAGRWTDALPLLEEAWGSAPKTPRSAWIAMALFEVLAQSSDKNRVMELLSESRNDLLTSLSDDSARLVQFSRSLLNVGLNEEAEPLLRDALRDLERLQSDGWITYHTKALLGSSLLGQENLAESETLLTDGYEGMKAHEKTNPGLIAIRIKTLDRLIELYTLLDKPDQLNRSTSGSKRYAA